MEDKKPKNALAKKLAEEKEKNNGLKINQRAYKFNFNAEKPRITYARQRIVFE